METEIAFTHEMKRRCFLQRSGLGLGGVALASLLGGNAAGSEPATLPHFSARAKRVIYLFQSGAPSQLDLFDYKPGLQKAPGQRTAGFHSPRATVDRHDRDPGELSGRGQQIPLSKARRKQNVDQRPSALHREDGR